MLYAYKSQILSISNTHTHIRKERRKKMKANKRKNWIKSFGIVNGLRERKFKK